MILISLLGLTLLAAGPDGALRVKTDVAGVKVILDDREAGETPVTITPVAPGRHRVTLLKPGYQDHTEEIEVQSGATAKLFVVMKPMKISLPVFPLQFRVVHVHRAGACIGDLILSADALEYRSDDGHDVFHLTIREMHSVARSYGPLPTTDVDWFPFRVAVLPMRVETPGRGYGFWAVDPQSKTADQVKLDEVVAQKTKELFEILYRLWATSLKKETKSSP